MHKETPGFVIANKNERIGRNPKTKVEVKIAARKVIKFKPAITTKEKLKQQWKTKLPSPPTAAENVDLWGINSVEVKESKNVIKNWTQTSY